MALAVPLSCDYPIKMAMESTATARLAHISDLHLTTSPLGWRWRDMFTKRTGGLLHLKVGRGSGFRDAERIVRSLRDEFRTRGIDHVIFSGDATSLGFPAEMEAAVDALGLRGGTALPGLAVPGNHDSYTKSAVRSGAFERLFAPWQVGERIGAERYPFAQRVGPCWLVGVNSSRSNSLVWDSRGEIGREQAERLRQLLDRLSPGPRILVTHYPLYLADGLPESRWRRLRDADQIADLAGRFHIALWLHGHRHNNYRVTADAARPVATICAGSTTQTGRAGWNEYLVEGTRLTMLRRVWDGTTGHFVDGESVVIDPLPLPD